MGAIIILSGTGPDLGLGIYILMDTPGPPGSLRITLPVPPETEDGTSIPTLITDLDPGIHLGSFPLDTLGIFLRRTPSHPISMRIITLDRSTLLGKYLPPGWWHPLLPTLSMRNIWTTLTLQVLLTPFQTPFRNGVGPTGTPNPCLRSPDEGRPWILIIPSLEQHWRLLLVIHLGLQ